MKADGGALVYIIIAVISLIVSAINQNNKKKARPVSQQNTDEPQTDTRSPWEREFEDIFGRGAKTPEQTEVYPEMKRTEPKPESAGSQEIILSNEAEEELKNYKGEISTTPKPEIRVQHDEKLTPAVIYEEVPVFFSGEEFDLRKAVLYSEVLNRKYF